jgi:hypothetical protein
MMDDQEVVRSVIANAIQFAAQGPSPRGGAAIRGALGSDESMSIAAAILTALVEQGFRVVRVPAEFPPFTNEGE